MSATRNCNSSSRVTVLAICLPTKELPKGSRIPTFYCTRPKVFSSSPFMKNALRPAICRSFSISSSNGLSVEGWRPLFEAASARADTVQKGLGQAIESELAKLERDWPRDLPQGVIHTDLFPDNV